MSIQHIYELFALDGQIFITEAYRNLLNREPDEHGMAYYLGRLAVGYSKAHVIAQLAKSQESRPHDEIIGLKKLIKAEKYINHWLWGLFGRWQRQERLLREGTQGLARVKQSIENIHDTIRLMPQQINEVNDAIQGISRVVSRLMQSELITIADSAETEMKPVGDVEQPTSVSSCQTESYELKILVPNIRDIFNEIKAVSQL